MRSLKQIAALAAVAVAVVVVLAPAAGATPTGGLSARGLRAYGKTLQAEAAAYKAGTAVVSTAGDGGFAWLDAGLGAAFAVAVLGIGAVLLVGRERRRPRAALE